jgi:UDP-N-acetyl-2-amino-2-deoxyglucuronate dehydrogenase
MKIWRFGIIGCGGIADFHIKAINELDNAAVTAVASRNNGKAEKAGRLAGCESMTDYREMLRRPDIDIVSVTASSGSHASIGREALKEGKHLVLEKPMAMKAVDAAELVTLAQERNLTLSVISQRRFEPQHRTVKRLIDEGAFGRLLLIEASVPFLRTQAYYDSADWRGTLSEDGGALMNQGIHSADLLLWLAGIPDTVYGKTATQTHRMEAEDLGLAILRFRSGCLGTLMASTSIQPGLQPTLNVYGETGTVKIIGSEIAFW